MQIYIDLLCIAAAVVFIVDVSGWTDTLLGALSKFTKKHGAGPVRSFKPLTCSLCMTWWCCLAYALLTRTFSLPVLAYIAGLATLSKTIYGVFIFIRELTSTAIGKLTERWTRY